MKIEQARAEHASKLTEIAISAKRHWNYPERWIELWIPSLTISPDYISQNETWMAVVEKPVGFYSLVDIVIARRVIFPPRNDKDSLWLDNLWILPNFMGQGIGKQLFQHALERSKALGASMLKIEADPNAQSFYEKMGVRKVGEHHSEMDGQPRILPIMEINL
jgi:GNAT superfamily N-acetyltransferase